MYLPEHVFNVNETGLYWKRMPSRGYISKKSLIQPMDPGVITVTLRKYSLRQTLYQAVKASDESRITLWLYYTVCQLFYCTT